MAFSRETFIAYIQSLIKDLNPNLENIYKYREKKVNGVTIGENGNGTIYKEFTKIPNDPFPDKINGESVNLFYKMNGDFHLIKVNVFTDETIQLSRLEIPIEIDVAEFERLINQKIILTDVPIGASVQIYGLGKFSIQNAVGYTNIYEKLLEVKDMMKQLKGEATAIEICIQAHKEYLDSPTIEKKEKLRAAYENISEHQRIYVGDMDTKRH